MTGLLLKYCGNKSLEDLLVTTNSNAHYIGFIFAGSKRQVCVDELSEWLSQVDIKDKKLVGVFVNATAEEIATIVSKVPLSIIQCHGNESVDVILDIKTKVNLPVWKAIHHQENALKIMQSLSGIVDGYIVDSRVKGMWGGTGVSFDWSAVPNYLEEAKRQGVLCFIAGGVSSKNVDGLLKHCPQGIDLSSGIELNNVKDKQLVDQLEERVGIYESSTR